MSRDADTKDLIKRVSDIPRNDYRLNSEKAEKPLGMLIGGLRLVDEFAKMSFKHIISLQTQDFLEVNKDVQLCLVNDHSDYYGLPVAGIAVFPLFESKFVGLGSISLGRYKSDVKEVTIEQMKIRKGELFFLNRENPEKGYYVEVRDSKHRDERFAAIYKLGTGSTKLLQFGSNIKGWYIPNLDDLRYSPITFQDEEPSYYGGIHFDANLPLILVKNNYDRLNRLKKDFKIEFKDDWATEKAGLLHE